MKFVWFLPLIDLWRRSSMRKPAILLCLGLVMASVLGLGHQSTGLYVLGHNVTGPQYPGRNVTGPQYPGRNVTGPQYPGRNVTGPQYVGRNVTGPPQHVGREASSSDTPRQVCSETPKDLIGKVPVVREVPDLRSLEALFPDVKPGGRWSPSHCVARHRVAIIVPYRDRLQNLRVFLHHMHQFLRKQELDYAIYVIEQSGQGDFNRAKLLNIGFEIPKKEYDYDCFVFHDVDLIPNYDKNIYACRENPYHLSICLDAQRYKPSYTTIFGGVTALRRQHMERLNGYSNLFWGWGGEDDDMSMRVRYSGFQLLHAPCHVGRYATLSHKIEKKNEARIRLIRRSHFRMYKDGLNSLKYRVLDIVYQKLFTHVTVDLFQHETPH